MRYQYRYAFSRNGRHIYSGQAKSGVLDKGVDALWSDGAVGEAGAAAWDTVKVKTMSLDSPCA